VPAAEVEPALREIDKSVTDKGPGGHILTGPIFVEGAEPGDALEVHIDKAELAIPYAYNGFGVGRGFLPDDFPYSRTRIIPLDARRWWPVSPRASRSRCGRSSAASASPARPRWVASTARRQACTAATSTTRTSPRAACSTCRLRPGGLLEIGDGHAAQGNGEVDITAIETSLVGTSASWCARTCT